MAFADDYIDVPARIAEFRAKHPDGTLRPADPSQPFQIVTVGDKVWLAYTAAAFRSPDDPAPGIGCAWEPVPGLTNFTKNSELQNAETSAWGRAIIAVGAADAKKGVASAEDVRNRQAEQRRHPPQAAPSAAAVNTWAETEALPAEVVERLKNDLIARAGADTHWDALEDPGWRKWVTEAIAHHKSQAVAP